MSSRMIKLIAALVAIGVICCYLFYLNPDPITVAYKPGATVQAPLAIVLISVFFFGALIVGGIFGLLSALQSFQEWQRERLYKRELANRGLLVTAREHLAEGNFLDARVMLEKIVAKEPGNILAWLSLADQFEAQGNSKEAVRVLDQARTHQGQNLELLFRAATLNEKLGNYTSAFDNLQIILTSRPGNLPALRKIIPSCEGLGRFDEAALFTRELLRRASADESALWQSRLADFEFRSLIERTDPKSGELRPALVDFLRKHREHPLTLAKLGELDFAAGNTSDAVKSWTKAYNSSRDATYLMQITQSWLAKDDPSRAVQSVKAAVYGAKSINGAELSASGSLFLIALYLKLELLSEAAVELDSLKSRAPLSREIDDQRRLLEARLLARQGKNDESRATFAALLAELISVPKEIHELISDFKRHEPHRRNNFNEAPSPELSTP